MKATEVLAKLQQRFPNQPEYFQAVEEVLESIEEEYNKHPEFDSVNLIERLCIPAGVPFARTYTVADIVADPQVRARGDLAVVPDPVVGDVRMQGVYPRLSRTPGRIRSGAPRLGAHNDEVYGKLLGLSAKERARLRAERVI